MAEVTRVYYNKLVRDLIPSKIAAKGEHCEVRPVYDAQEFQQELMKKIKEEAASLAMSRTREEFLAEYVDLVVVLETLTAQLEISDEDINVAREENLRKKGTYADRNFLVWSEDGEYSSNESPQGILL